MVHQDLSLGLSSAAHCCNWELPGEDVFRQYVVDTRNVSSYYSSLWCIVNTDMQDKFTKNS